MPKIDVLAVVKLLNYLVDKATGKVGKEESKGILDMDVLLLIAIDSLPW